MTSKLEILKQEFQACKNRNPIENIETRVKSPESIKGKMERRGFPLTISSMVKNIMDIAGIRVVCPFISDVYYIAEFLLKQEDIEEIQIKDYIKNPKENGYRSLHLIVMVTVYFSDHKCNVPVEIQLRTIAMEFWATLEHQLRYKKNRNRIESMQKQLKQCAELVTKAVLYFYAVWKGTCDQCGRIRPGGSKYCDRCGKQFAKECPDCGQTVDIMADYCGNCGKKLSEEEDV